MNRVVSLEGKTKLPVKIQETITDAGAVCRQMIKGSKANEQLTVVIRNFALQEAAVDNSESNLKRMAILTHQLKSQADNLQNSVELISEVQDQLLFLERKAFWAPHEPTV